MINYLRQNYMFKTINQTENINEIIEKIYNSTAPFYVMSMQ